MAELIRESMKRGNNTFLFEFFTSRLRLFLRLFDEPVQDPDHAPADRPGMALLVMLFAIDHHREVPELLGLPVLLVSVVPVDDAVALMVLDQPLDRNGVPVRKPEGVDLAFLRRDVFPIDPDDGAGIDCRKGRNFLFPGGVRRPSPGMVSTLPFTKRQ
jgi:hypothetical protein